MSSNHVFYRDARNIDFERSRSRSFRPAAGRIRERVTRAINSGVGFIYIYTAYSRVGKDGTQRRRFVVTRSRDVAKRASSEAKEDFS